MLESSETDLAELKRISKCRISLYLDTISLINAKLTLSANHLTYSQYNHNSSELGNS